MPVRRRIPALTLHKPSGQARVRIAGKDHYLGPHGSAESVAAYSALIEKFLGNGPTSEVIESVPSSEITVSEVILKYGKHCQTHFVDESGNPNQDFGHVRSVLRMLKEQFGRLPISKVTGLHIEQLQKAMVKKDWSRSYCNSQLGQVRRFFRWAVGRDLCPPDVREKVGAIEGLREGKTSARETDPVRPVADDVIEQTLPFLPPVVADLVRVIRYTAARGKEIRTLQVGDVQRSGNTYETTLRKHKNRHRRHRRVIVFGPKASAIIAAHIADRRPDEFVFSPRRSREQQLSEKRRRRRTRVQPSQMNRRRKNASRVPGDMYSASVFARAIQRACEAAFGMPAELRNVPTSLPKEKQAELRKLAIEWRKEHTWHPNQLRHTAATEIASRFGLEVTKSTLGHARIETTQIYAERDLKQQRSVMNEIG